MTKKKTARKRPPAVPAPAADVRPANFGLIYTNLGSQIVMGVQGPSFTIFRSKRDAVDWLRNLARSIEDSNPSY